ncbi:MAG: carboxypeptidase regulatory-like domain-containing protein [Planctomycetota bacterium]|nr:MAG: carboxypeptidase regulatory-like domain-containing protein [Planctomycetota bacterium]
MKVPPSPFDLAKVRLILGLGLFAVCLGLFLSPCPGSPSPHSSESEYQEPGKTSEEESLAPPNNSNFSRERYRAPSFKLGDHEISITVIDESTRQGIRAVDVFYDHGQEEIYLGLTDGKGVLATSLPALSVSNFHCKHEDYEQKNFAFRQPIPPELTLELSQGGTIQGIVKKASGEPAPEGFTVVAWPRKHPPLLNEKLDFVHGKPTKLLQTQTNSEGAFTLKGLSRPGEYLIVCGGPGFFSARPLLARAGDQGIVVSVMELFGSVLELEIPPPVQAGFLPSYLSPIFAADRKPIGRTIWPGDPFLALAGLPLDLPSGQSKNVFYSCMVP